MHTVILPAGRATANESSEELPTCKQARQRPLTELIGVAHAVPPRRKARGLRESPFAHLPCRQRIRKASRGYGPRRRGVLHTGERRRTFVAPASPDPAANRPRRPTAHTSRGSTRAPVGRDDRVDMLLLAVGPKIGLVVLKCCQCSAGKS